MSRLGEMNAILFKQRSASTSRLVLPLIVMIVVGAGLMVVAGVNPPTVDAELMNRLIAMCVGAAMIVVAVIVLMIALVCSGINRQPLDLDTARLVITADVDA